MEVQVAYAISVAHSLPVIVEIFDLRRPIYQKTAAYRHFGHDDIEFPWEKTDKAEALKKVAGL